jgi:hypothetical protein
VITGAAGDLAKTGAAAQEAGGRWLSITADQRDIGAVCPPWHRLARRLHPGRPGTPVDPGHHVAFAPARQFPMGHRADGAAGYRSRMPSRSARPELGLFDNPAGAFRLEELTETARALERQRSGRTVGELSRTVFAELAMKRTRRSAELVTEAIRLARAREPHGEISGSGGRPAQRKSGAGR